MELNEAAGGASTTGAREERSVAEDGELRALIRWVHTEGVGPTRLREAIDAVGSANALLEHPRASPLLGLHRATVVPDEVADRVLEACRRRGIRAVGWHHGHYPAALRNLPDPPPVVFVRGAMVPDSALGVAIVGSRRASEYGRRAARDLARGLARQGIPVVSGMALGVDGEAHAGALEQGGYTLAVLGGGVERARPTSHRRLYRKILSTGGSIVSEWAPGTPARAFHFPRRNRIIAALAHLVVVVEAGERSGALSTAAHARRLGREVAAVPGPIDRPGHRGSNQLIRDGCAPVLELQDVLDRVGAIGALLAETPLPPIHDPSARLVFDALSAGPATVEGLVGRLDLPTVTVLRALTRLEIGGRIAREHGGVLRRLEP